MTRRLRRFLALRPTERRLFIGTWLILPIIDLMLRGLGLRRTQRILGRSAALFSRGQAQAAGPAAVAAAEAKAAIIAIAGRYALANGTCLRQALLLWWLLKRRDQAAELRIGVRTENGFAAHAWVELDGKPLGQTPEQRNRFVRMQAFGRS
jgi:hypothetical protein